MNNTSNIRSQIPQTTNEDDSNKGQYITPDIWVKSWVYIDRLNAVLNDEDWRVFKIGYQIFSREKFETLINTNKKNLDSWGEVLFDLSDMWYIFFKESTDFDDIQILDIQKAINLFKKWLADKWYQVIWIDIDNWTSFDRYIHFITKWAKISKKPTIQK